MMRESRIYKISAAVHIVFFISILSFLTTVLSGTVLLLPALGAVFLVGKEVIYKRINIYDSIVKTYFKYLRQAIKLMKFLPVQLIMILNAVGMVISAANNHPAYSVLCLSVLSILLAFLMYLAGCFTFLNEKVNSMEVILIIFLKPQYFLSVFAGIVLYVFFFSVTLLAVLAFCGAVFIIAAQAVILIPVTHYKKMAGIPEEKEDFPF